MTGNGWDALRGILEEQQAEYEAYEDQKLERCPHDGELLERRPDGSMWCKFDGQVTLFEILGEERRQ